MLDVQSNKVPPADNVPQTIDETISDNDRDNDAPQPVTQQPNAGNKGANQNGSSKKYFYQQNRHHHVPQSLDHQQTRQYSPPYTKYYHSKQSQTSLSSDTMPVQFSPRTFSAIILVSMTFSAVCLFLSICWSNAAWPAKTTFPFSLVRPVFPHSIHTHTHTPSHPMFVYMPSPMRLVLFICFFLRTFLPKRWSSRRYSRQIDTHTPMFSCELSCLCCFCCAFYTHKHTHFSFQSAYMCHLPFYLFIISFALVPPSVHNSYPAHSTGQVAHVSCRVVIVVVHSHRLATSHVL